MEVHGTTDKRVRVMDPWDSEQVVEQMHAKAEDVIRDVFAEFEISHVVAAFSGGDDSVVATHWAMNRFPDAVVMIGDTQIGLQKTRDHQEAVVQQNNWHRERVSPTPEGPPRGWDREWIDGGTSYEEFALNHGFPGNQQHARMYQRLKQRAFRKIKPLLGQRKRGSRILVISGIRRDQSAIRAGYQRAYQEEPTECFVWANPFYYCSKQDFEVYRQEFGLPRNPVKSLVGISGECECGAHAVKGEREAITKAEPAFADYLFGDLEKRVMERFPWPWDGKPPTEYVEHARRAKRLKADKQVGQKVMFSDEEVCGFMPACVGCNRKAAK